MARQPRQLAGIGASDLPNQASVDAYKGPPREIIIGTETIHIQDGVTPGGIPLARRSDVALKLDKTLPLAGDLLSRPAEGKIRERKSLLDFIDPALHASIADGTIASTVDLSDALAKAAAYVRAGLGRLVIPSGVYPYSVSPQWAVSMGRIDIEGEVRFRYTGTGRAFILNQGTASTTVHTYNMHVGKPSAPLIIEAGAGADHAVFAKAINHSELHFVVRGCGPNSAALYTEGGVCSNYGLVASVNESGWYQGAKPGFGWIAAGLTGEGAAGQCSYVILKDPKIEGVAKGAVLRFALGSGIVGGTIEGCSDYAIDILAGCDECIIERHDLEANGGFDIRDNGRGTRIVNCDSTAKNLSHQTTSGILIGGASVSAQIKGGRHNTVIVLAGAKGLRAMMFDIGRDGDGNMSIQAGATVYRRGVFNRQTQAFLPDLDGDASSVTASATGLSTPRILADWLKYPISLERFGCKGDFNGTTGTDNSSAIAGAIASGEKLVASAGKRYLFDAPTIVTGRPFHISSDQQSSALVYTGNAVRGLVISPANFDQGVCLDGLNILTLGRETGSGLTIAYNDAEALTRPWHRRVRLNGVVVRGVDIYSNGWKRGVELKNCYWYDIEDLSVTGRQNEGATLAADCTFMDEAFYAETGDYSIGGGYIRGLRLYYAKDGVKLVGAGTSGGQTSGTAMEGVNIDQVDIVGAIRGINFQCGLASPGLVVTSGHLNIYGAGIVAKRANQAIFDNILVYKHPGSRQEAVMLDLDYCDHTKSTNITGINQTSDASVAGGWVGLRLRHTNRSKHEIKIERPSIGADIDTATCSKNNVECMTDGTLLNGATVLSNVSTYDAADNVVRRSMLRRAYSNAANVQINNAVPTVVQSDALDVLKGETYRVTASISHAMGATASDVLFDFFKASGTASVQFMATAPSVGQRLPQSANASGAFFMSALMQVTASGTLVVGVRGYTAQSSATGTVPATNAQLTIESA